MANSLGDLQYHPNGKKGQLLISGVMGCTKVSPQDSIKQCKECFLVAFVSIFWQVANHQEIDDLLKLLIFVLFWSLVQWLCTHLHWVSFQGCTWSDVCSLLTMATWNSSWPMSLYGGGSQGLQERVLTLMFSRPVLYMMTTSLMPQLCPPVCVPASMSWT